MRKGTERRENKTNENGGHSMELRMNKRQGKGKKKKRWKGSEGTIG